VLINTPPFYGETTPAPDQRGGVGVDDRLMREPRLLVPHCKPIGEVRFLPKLENPELAFLFQNNYINSGSSRLLRKLTHTSSKFGSDSVGRYISSTGDNATEDTISNLFGTSNGVGTGALTVLVAGKFTTAAARKVIAQYRDAAAPYATFAVVANSYIANGSTSYTDSSGYFYMGTFEQGPNGRGVYASDGVDNKFHVWAAKRNSASDWKLFKDGELITTYDTSSVADISGAGRVFSIMGHTHTSGYGYNAPLYYFFQWDHELSDALLLDLTRNGINDYLIPA
jgi:hypothetical protein